MRYIGFFSFFIGFVCCLTGCASNHKEPIATVAFVGAVERVEMWRPTKEEWTEHWIQEGLMETPQGKALSDEVDAIIVSNSCGMTKAEFDVYSATARINNRFIVSTTLGEWCRSKFEYQEEYFVIAKGGDVLVSRPIYYTEKGEMVLEVSEEELSWYRKDSGLSLSKLIVESFPSPAIDPSHPSTKDPDVLEYIELNDGWSIQNINGKDRVVLTKGVMLKNMFPELESDYQE